MEAIKAAAVMLHVFGSVFLALGFINLAVLLRRYWFRSPEKKFLFFKIPEAGGFFLVYAAAFLLLSLIFFFVVIGQISATNQFPRFAGMLVLVWAGIWAFFSVRDFSKFISKRAGKK